MLPSSHSVAIEEFAAIRGVVGPASAREERRLLGTITEQRRFRVRALVSLHERPCFLRAQLDERNVHDAPREVGEHLSDWVAELPAGGDMGASREEVTLLMTVGERQGLDDVNLNWRTWIDRCNPDPARSTLPADDVAVHDVMPRAGLVTTGGTSHRVLLQRQGDRTGQRWLRGIWGELS